MERLNKVIAKSGLVSRRGADELIKEGRVQINNTTVTELATLVSKDDVVKVDNNIINISTNLAYVMFHKPKGCITTTSDDKGRRTIFDYIDLNIPHLLPVGRLDYNTEGLLLLTNDGDLAYALTHPSKEVDKTYIATIKGTIREDELARIRKGIKLDDGYVTKKAKIKIVKVENNLTRLELKIYEGKNREIRRIFEALKKDLVFLKRTAIGSLKLGGLSRGSYRFLTEKEIYELKRYE